MGRLGDLFLYLRSTVVKSKSPYRFGWVIEGELAGSGRLMSPLQLAWATSHGIKSVVTIREFPLEASWFSNRNDIMYRHIQVKDHSAPPMKELGEIVTYIETEITHGRPVIVHCNGGSGRTGTVLAAYLMKKNGLTAQQAVRKVKEIRGRTASHKKQLDTLEEYEKYLLTVREK
ncbi:MAG TPA: dual specificity protein phosphatase family protein [Nitrososphaeraceae archaeon]|jgi:atypical dual specificity phosphatase